MKLNNKELKEEIKAKYKFFGSGIEDDYDMQEDEFSEEYEEIEEDVIGDVLNCSISSGITGLQFESIISSLKSGYFVIPGFQRKFVWTQKQVASLALSIIKGIPVPPLYVYVDNKTKKQVILDGQQRVTAIFLYFYGLFFVEKTERQKLNFKDVAQMKERIDDIDKRMENYTRSNNKRTQAIKDEIKQLKLERKELCDTLRSKYGLKLSAFTVENVNKESVDISFSVFDENSREYLLRKDFNIAVVRCNDRHPQKIFANIFKVLNTGGKILGTQEIRNGIYWETELYKRLFALNEENENWRKIYGKISQFSKDVEILLKMLALNYYTVYENDRIETDYDGTFNWTNIMEGYSESCIDLPEESIDSDIQLLMNYLDVLVFDDDTKKCNKAVFEAVFVAFCKLGLLDRYYSPELKLRLSWIKWLEEKTDIFEKVLSNKASVESRLTGTISEVRAEYAKYIRKCKQTI